MGALPDWHATPTGRYAHVPVELRAFRQWVVWKLVMKDGDSRFSKIPYDARTGRPASSVDPSAWATFDEAVAAAGAVNAHYAGIGFVFTENDPYVGIDLDHCIDAVTGEIAADAVSMIAGLDSYTERSPSRTGVHIIVRGKLPAGGRKKGGTEMYEAGRYFTVTGDHLPSTRATVEDRSKELLALHHRVFSADKVTPITPSVRQARRATSGTDDDVIGMIRNSSDAAKFNLLYGGEWKSTCHPSQSEADLALCGIIARHTQDTAQVDRIFRSSRLYREKWDEQRGDKTYGEKTVARAVDVNANAGGDPSSDHEDQAHHEATLAKFNAAYALVRIGDNVRVLEEHRDANGRVDRISLLKQSDFNLAVKNWPILGRKSPNPGGWWLGHPKRREFRALDFVPGGAEEGVYNLWQGFPVAGRAGVCDLFWAFVREVICAGDTEMYCYVRRYMAHAIQRPGERPEVGIVLRGGQGTGKNTFVEALGELVAPHFCTLNHMDDIVGRFNKHLMNRLVVHANEALWGGNRSEAGKLKAIITDPTFHIEPKGVDKMQISNYVRLFVSSNEDWAVPIDFDDRRFVILDVSNCRKQDTAYFAAIYAEMKSGGREALMHDLLHEDLDGFHPRMKPRARFGFDMKIRSAHSVARWLYECLQEGHLIGDARPPNFPAIGWDEWEAGLERDIIRFAYRGWCRQQNERHPADGPELFKQLKKVLPEVGAARPTSAISGKRTWCTTFPALAAARLSFAKAMNADGQVAWEPE